MNPIAAQNPEEIPGPLTYITLAAGRLFNGLSSDRCLRGRFSGPISLNATDNDATAFYAGQPHVWAGIFQVRDWNGCWRCLAAESLSRKEPKRPHSRLSVKRRGGKCKCLCDSLSSLHVIMEVGYARHDASPSIELIYSSEWRSLYEGSRPACNFTPSSE